MTQEEINEVMWNSLPEWRKEQILEQNKQATGGQYVRENKEARMTPYERMDIRQELKKLCYNITSLPALVALEDYLINKCKPSDEEKEIIVQELKNRREQLWEMQNRRTR